VKIHQSELIRGKQKSIRNTFYSSYKSFNVKNNELAYFTFFRFVIILRMFYK